MLDIEYNCICKISIHAPIVGCDFLSYTYLIIHPYFNPRTHRGVRLETQEELDGIIKISIHAPIVGCDLTAFIIFL